MKKILIGLLAITISTSAMARVPVYPRPYPPLPNKVYVIHENDYTTEKAIIALGLIMIGGVIIYHALTPSENIPGQISLYKF